MLCSCNMYGLDVKIWVSVVAILINTTVGLQLDQNYLVPREFIVLLD